MSQTISIEKASAGLADLVHSLGPNDEIILTENDLAVARIVPSTVAALPRVPGLMKGKLVIVDDDDAHLEDFKEYMP